MVFFFPQKTAFIWITLPLQKTNACFLRRPRKNTSPIFFCVAAKGAIIACIHGSPPLRIFRCKDTKECKKQWDGKKHCHHNSKMNIWIRFSNAENGGVWEWRDNKESSKLKLFVGGIIEGYWKSQLKKLWRSAKISAEWLKCRRWSRCTPNLHQLHRKPWLSVQLVSDPES